MLLVTLTLIPVMLIIPVKFEHVTFQYRHLTAQVASIHVFS